MVIPVNQNLLKKVDDFRKSLVWLLLPHVACFATAGNAELISAKLLERTSREPTVLPDLRPAMAAPAMACGIVCRKTRRV